MQAEKIVNTIVDEANRRTYVILAPRVLTDGEIYRLIRQEILRRGGRPLAQGETLTLTVTSSGGTIASSTQSESQNELSGTAASNLNEAEHVNSSPGPLGKP